MPIANYLQKVTLKGIIKTLTHQFIVVNNVFRIIRTLAMFLMTLLR